MQCTSSTPIRWASTLAFCLLFVGAVVSSNAWSAERVYIAHCAQACPQAEYAQEIVVHHLYAAAITPQTGLARWVAYRVLGGTVGVASLLPRSWQVDPLLDAERQGGAGGAEIAQEVDFQQPDLSSAQDREYRVNELVYPDVARGRLAPMTSFAGTPYWQELNNLSNMAPLPEDLRTGSWARLEQRINALAHREGEVFVVSGPLPQNNDNIEIPGAYFKVVIAGERIAAFVFPVGLPLHASHCAQQSTLQAIEQATSLNLFPALAAASGSLNVALGCGKPGQ